MSGCRGPVETDDEVPRIHVRYLEGRVPELVAFVEHGIEEEGVSWVVRSTSGTDPVAVAHEAAIASSLGIGTCVTSDSRVVIHDERLPEDDPIFDTSDATTDHAGRLGSNAARLAKGRPLKSIPQ